ncbi:hypothetical protein ACTXT7_015370 [Hymenolepis weldensis]
MTLRHICTRKTELSASISFINVLGNLICLSSNDKIRPHQFRIQLPWSTGGVNTGDCKFDAH